MAKFKIQAGAEIDTCTKKEMEDAIAAASTNWIGEVARGDRFRRFSAYGDVLTNTITIGESPDSRIGPDPGFVWAVRRIALSVVPAAGDNIKLYHDSDNDSALICTDITNYLGFDQGELVLYPGDTLLIKGAYTASDGVRVWVTGQARELPISLAWRI